MFSYFFPCDYLHFLVSRWNKKKKIAVWANGVQTVNFQVVPGRETEC